MNARQTAEYIGVSLTTFWKMRKDDSFPKGKKILKTTKWSKKEIDEWIESKRKP